MSASKRSIMKMRNRSFSGGNRTSPSGVPQLSDGGISPTISVVSAADDIKRLRPDCDGNSPRDAFKNRSLRRIRNHSVPTQLESSFAKNCASLSSSEVVCKTSLLSKPRLQKLLSMELDYHPNNAFLYYVDPVVEDKVDATLRNEAVHGLRCIHNAFFTLSAEAFCKAVNLIDRFVVKVKVKPKYMSCVAAAAYHIAARLSESTPANQSMPPTLDLYFLNASSLGCIRIAWVISPDVCGPFDIEGRQAVPHEFDKLMNCRLGILPPMVFTQLAADCFGVHILGAGTKQEESLNNAILAWSDCGVSEFSQLIRALFELGVPNPDTLVQISRCGGNSADLLRLEDIITTKLGGDLDGVNAYDFLRLFASAAVVFPDSGTFPPPRGQEADIGHAGSVEEEVRSDDGEGDDEVFMEDSPVGGGGGGGNGSKVNGQRLLGPISRGCSRSLPDDPRSASSAEVAVAQPSAAAPQSRRMYDLWSAMTSRLVVSLCSLEVYRYRPATLALSILLQLRVVGVPGLARLCNVKMDDVRQCSALVEELYDIYYLEAPPSQRRALVWTLSRRTLCRIGCSSPTPLDTISEDCENDKEDNLQFLFEP
ncbi:regulation of cell cycle [Sparganum proliferum]